MENKEVTEVINEEDELLTEASSEAEGDLEVFDEIVEKEKIRKKRKRATVIVTGMLVIAIILCLWVISQVLSKGYISVAGYSLFRVATGSMEPEMPIGTLLISKDIDIEDVKIDDVVNFRSKEEGMVGMVITHRVIAIHKNTDGKVFLETRGDANQYSDIRPVEEDNLIGIVVCATGEGNFFADLVTFLTSKIGFWSFIVLPCILIGVMIMKDTIKTMRNEMDAIHKELDDISNTVKSKDEALEKRDEETYEEMYERLRKELLEELGQNVEHVETDDAAAANTAED